jgi:hypothetical protein
LGERKLWATTKVFNAAARPDGKKGVHDSFLAGLKIAV